MNPEVLDADNEEWMSLSRFENFVSSRIKILSMSAACENNEIMQEAQLPEGMKVNGIQCSTKNYGLSPM